MALGQQCCLQKERVIPQGCREPAGGVLVSSCSTEQSPTEQRVGRLRGGPGHREAGWGRFAQGGPAPAAAVLAARLLPTMGLVVGAGLQPDLFFPAGGLGRKAQGELPEPLPQGQSHE